MRLISIADGQGMFDADHLHFYFPLTGEWYEETVISAYREEMEYYPFGVHSQIVTVDGKKFVEFFTLLVVLSTLVAQEGEESEAYECLKDLLCRFHAMRSIVCEKIK